MITPDKIIKVLLILLLLMLWPLIGGQGGIYPSGFTQ